MPPVKKPGPPAEVLRRYLSPVPLRRAPVPPRSQEAIPAIPPAAVDESLAAVAGGQGTELPLGDRELPVLIAPAVVEVIQRSGLGAETVKRLYDRLADKLGSRETVAGLPPWTERPGCVLYRGVLGGSEAAHDFTFIISVQAEQPAVVVAACEYRRVRIA